VPGARRSLYIANPDGSGLRWLTYFNDHHSWTPDGKQVLLNGRKTVDGEINVGDRRMFLIDFDGSNRRMVIDEPFGSHPLMDPTGRMIADHHNNGIAVVHVEAQEIEQLSVFRGGYDTSHSGTHPHCVWNRDGSQLLYNSAETGQSELYLVQF